MESEIYVFTKHFNYGDYWYMQGVMASGKLGVYHCCDYHFDTKHRNHYRRMIETADIVLASTPEMASLIKMETRRDATVIPDSYEFPEKEPSYSPGAKLKVLWYGHFSNIDSLMDIRGDLKDYDLRLCTMPNAVPKELEGMMVLPYSKQNLEHAFGWCDAVIIPSRSDTHKLVKSHNRLTEAVRQGKFVIASALPSYREFDDWMYIGEVPEGLEWLSRKDPEDICNRIKKAQDHVKDNYNPEKVGKMWETALSN